MDEIILKLLECLIIILITAVIRYGIPFMKQKIGESKLEEVAGWVQKAVKAAEQTITEPGSGEEKKAIVTEFISNMLIQKNINITSDQINTLIEAAVFAMKQETK